MNEGPAVKCGLQSSVSVLAKNAPVNVCSLKNACPPLCASELRAEQPVHFGGDRNWWLQA